MDVPLATSYIVFQGLKGKKKVLKFYRYKADVVGFLRNIFIKRIDYGKIVF